jgi:hypothetical protein
MYVMAEKIIQIIEHDLLGNGKRFTSKAYRTIMLSVKYKNTKFYSVNTIRRNNKSEVHWKKEESWRHVLFS